MHPTLEKLRPALRSIGSMLRPHGIPAILGDSPSNSDIQASYRARDHRDAGKSARVMELLEASAGSFDQSEARQAALSKNFPSAPFAGLLVEGLTFPQANFHRIDLSGIHFKNCVFAEQRRSWFDECKLQGAYFENCTFKNGLELVNCQCPGLRFEGTLEAGHLQFSRCDLRAALIDTQSRISRIHGSGADAKTCQGTHILNADLRACGIQDVSLRGAAFSDIRVDRDTKFTRIGDTRQFQMDRYLIACLGDDVGGLTEGQRMDMRIPDGVAELRRRYSGFWFWFHLTALLIFVFPYLWFILSSWAKARFLAPSDYSVTLGTALLQYVVSGGQTIGRWQLSWLSLSVGVALAYNTLRFVMLARTKDLENQQLSSGLPVRFSLSTSGLGKLDRALGFKRLGGLYAAVVVWPTLHFLSMRVPIAH